MRFSSPRACLKIIFEIPKKGVDKQEDFDIINIVV
jgi:hypothetical protein